MPEFALLAGLFAIKSIRLVLIVTSLLCNTLNELDVRSPELKCPASFTLTLSDCVALKLPVTSSNAKVNVAVVLPGLAPVTLDMVKPDMLVSSSKRLLPEPANTVPDKVTSIVAR